MSTFIKLRGLGNKTGQKVKGRAQRGWIQEGKKERTDSRRRYKDGEAAEVTGSKTCCWNHRSPAEMKEEQDTEHFSNILFLQKRDKWLSYSLQPPSTVGPVTCSNLGYSQNKARTFMKSSCLPFLCSEYRIQLIWSNFFLVFFVLNVF